MKSHVKNYRNPSSLTGIALCAAAGMTLLTASNVAKADQYVALSYGYADLDGSSNSGNFPDGFTTGAGTTVPAGTPLPAGASVGWNTEFDSGDTFAIAYGVEFEGALRAELELSRQDNDVETHSGVTVLDDLAIDSEDAGILITGSDNLGASVGDIVADGRGGIETDYIMVNAYYDFNREATLSPFFGIGIGYADANIVYNPSGVGIVDDSDSAVAYQVSLGATLELTDTLDLVGKVQYRASEDFEVDTTLFPAVLEIENSSVTANIGVRLNF